MKLKFRVISGVSILVLLAGVIVGGTSYASEKFDKVGIGANPTNSGRLKLSPGDEYNGSFRAVQAGNETNEVTISVEPLSKQDEVSNYEVETERTRISEWVSLSTSDCNVLRTEGKKIIIEMLANSQCTVNYTINVPEDAMGGSQNAGIMLLSVPYSELNRENEGAVGINMLHRFAYGLNTDVDGPGARYEGKVIKNNVPWLFLSKPIYISSLIENTGNLDFRADYEILIKNYIGGVEVYKRDFSKTVFADSESSDEMTWEETPEFGIFEVTQNIDVLGEESNITHLVLVIPIWWLILIVATLLLIIWAIVVKVKQWREKNKRLNS